MAKEKISMAYNLSQSNNENSPTYGLWYPQPVRRDTLSLRGLADVRRGRHVTLTPRQVERIVELLGEP